MIVEIGSLEGTPKNIFLGSFTKRADELIEQGIFSEDFMEGRRESAALIEGDFTDPEKQGREFAEIGMEATIKFREGVDSLCLPIIQDAEAQLQNMKDKIKSLGSDLSPEDQKKVDEISARIEDYTAAIEDFKTRVEEIKTFSSKSGLLGFPGLLKAIESLEKKLGEE